MYVNTKFDDSKATPTSHAKTDNIYENASDGSEPTPLSHAKIDHIYENAFDGSKPTPPSNAKTDHIYDTATTLSHAKGGSDYETLNTNMQSSKPTNRGCIYGIMIVLSVSLLCAVAGIILAALAFTKDQSEDILELNDTSAAGTITTLQHKLFEVQEAQKHIAAGIITTPQHQLFEVQEAQKHIQSSLDKIKKENALQNQYLNQLVQDFKEFKRIADVNECASSPCHNRGSCIDKSDGYMCICSEGFTGIQCEETSNKDCGDIYISGLTTSGVYRIKPSNYESPFDVYCDMDSQGGGWTLIPRRFNGSENFNRTWIEYKNGFGNKNGEHWLGLEKVYHMTNKANQPYTFRVDLTDFDLNTAWQEYLDFNIASEQSHYNLMFNKVGTTGTAGNSLNYHYGCPFSTYDKDLDASAGINYALKYGGAWWFKNSHHCALNNQYFAKNTHDGMVWKGFHDDEVLKAAQMKIRPSNFCNYVSSC